MGRSWDYDNLDQAKPKPQFNLKFWEAKPTTYIGYINNCIKTTKYSALKFTNGFSTKVKKVVNTTTSTFNKEGETPIDHKKVVDDYCATKKVTIDDYGETSNGNSIIQKNKKSNGNS